MWVFEQMRNDLEASVIKFVRISEEILAILEKAINPVIQVLMELGDLCASWIFIEFLLASIFDGFGSTLELQVETPSHLQSVARLIWPSTKLISSIVHRLVKELGQEVPEIFCDGPRALAPTHVDIKEVLLHDRTFALLGLLEEFAPARCRLTKMVDDFALPTFERRHVTFKQFQALGALVVDLESLDATVEHVMNFGLFCWLPTSTGANTCCCAGGPCL